MKITPRAEVERRQQEINANAKFQVTLADYNDTLEGYLKETRSARGYTDRDPSEYYNSSVPRWAQDARDWVAFRDRVMLYGLQILNQYQESGDAPMSLDAFKGELRKIQVMWHDVDTVDGSETDANK